MLLLTIDVIAQDVNIVFPDDANVIDVTKSPFNADTTGKNDATHAIQAAIDSSEGKNRIIYLPNGVYSVCSTLVWPGDASAQKRCIMQGQSRDGTIIRMTDNNPLYQDTTLRRRHLQGVIYTGGGPAQRFRNSVRNLTVDVGKGNPFLSGIQFFANNQGTVRHVKIVAGEGSGEAGLDMGGTTNGPLLAYDVVVEGFNHGIFARNHINSVTLEKIVVRNQRVAGVFNTSWQMSMRDLTSENSVVAVINQKSGGTMALSKATLTGGSSSIAAIENTASLFARDITTSGYGKAIENTTGHQRDFDGSVVDEFVSDEVETQYDGAPTTSLDLPVEELPHVPWGPLSDWGNVCDYGNVDDFMDDAGPAIQAAIDAGHKTVYFPGGRGYNLRSTVYIRGNCHRLIGCEAGFAQTSKTNGPGKFVVTDGTAPVVWFERFDFLDCWDRVTLEHNSSRTLVVSSVSALPISVNGTGKLFIADAVGSQFHLNNPAAKVWARQLNPENNDSTHISVKNLGGQFWVLGMKTEGKAMDVKVLTTNGGSTEILGGMIHNNSRANNANAIFRTDCSRLSVAGVRYHHVVDPPFHYRWWVEESVEDDTRWLDLVTYNDKDDILELYRSSDQTLSSGGTCGSGAEPPSPTGDTISCGLLPNIGGFMANGSFGDALGYISSEAKGELQFCEDAMEGTHSMVFDGASWLKIHTLVFGQSLSSRSIAMWVKPHKVSDTMILFEEKGKVDGLGLRIAEGKLQSRVRERTQTPCDLSHPISPNVWKHVALVYGNSKAYLYVDGVEVASGDAPADVRGSNSGAGLGGRNDKDCWDYGGWGHHFSGQLDDVRFWDSAITSSQVQELYACGSATGKSCVPAASADAAVTLGKARLTTTVAAGRIRFSGIDQEPCKITILDSKGRVIRSLSVAGKVNHIETVPSSGIYYVQYRTTSGVRSRMLAITRR